MKSKRVLQTILSVALAPSLLGCTIHYSVRPVEITVEHYATSKPAANIGVTVVYACMLAKNPPPRAAGRTDVEGKIVLPIADPKRSGIDLEIEGLQWYYYGLTTQVIRYGGDAEEPAESDRHYYTISLKPLAK